MNRLTIGLVGLLLSCASVERREHYQQLPEPEQKVDYYYCLSKEYDFSREQCLQMVKEGKQFAPYAEKRVPPEVKIGSGYQK